MRCWWWWWRCCFVQRMCTIVNSICLFLNMWNSYQNLITIFGRNIITTDEKGEDGDVAFLFVFSPSIFVTFYEDDDDDVALSFSKACAPLWLDHLPTTALAQASKNPMSTILLLLLVLVPGWSKRSFWEKKGFSMKHLFHGRWVLKLKVEHNFHVHLQTKPPHCNWVGLWGWRCDITRYIGWHYFCYFYYI